MREEFETWVIQVKSAELVVKCGGGMKRSSCETIVKATWFPNGGMAPMACELFEAWQASREALVIALPEEDEPVYHPPGSANQGFAIGFNDCRDQCAAAIEAAGLKVRS